MLILPMNMEYIKGPTKVINNLAYGLRQISKPYNVNSRQLLALNMYISLIMYMAEAGAKTFYITTVTTVFS